MEENREEVIEGIEGVVLDEGVEVSNLEATEQESEIDYETETKKFQSMYDKRNSEYEKLNTEAQELRKYEQLGKILEERPDVVEAMKNTLSNNNSNSPKEKLDADSFDPWDAYYKPDSPSYQMRVSQERAVANEIVQEQLGGMQQAMALNSLKSELSSKFGMEDNAQVEQFIQFATNPKEDVPLDVLVDVFRQRNGMSQKDTSPNIEAVKRAQQVPQTAGIVQGGEPKKPNEVDDVWNQVMNAGSRSNIL
jgi:hypothetical protein